MAMANGKWTLKRCYTEKIYRRFKQMHISSARLSQKLEFKPQSLKLITETVGQSAGPSSGLSGANTNTLNPTGTVTLPKMGQTWIFFYKKPYAMAPLLTMAIPFDPRDLMRTKAKTVKGQKFTVSQAPLKLVSDHGKCTDSLDIPAATGQQPK